MKNANYVCIPSVHLQSGVSIFSLSFSLRLGVWNWNSLSQLMVRGTGRPMGLNLRLCND